MTEKREIDLHPEWPRRVAFLVDSFPVMSETFVGTEIRAVEDLGCKVDVLAFRDPKSHQQPIDAKLAAQTTYLGGPSRPALTWQPQRLAKACRFATVQKALPRGSLLYHGARIARLLTERGVDHIHAHFAWGSAAHAIVAARLAGITISFVGHGSDVFQTPTDLAAKVRFADVAVATCEDTARLYSALAPRARIATIACGIDPSRFRPPEVSADHNGRLILVARLIERKGGRESLEALARLPRRSRPGLDIVGDGPERTPLMNLARRLELEDVDFLGPRPSDWLREHLPGYLALLAPFFEGTDGGRDTGPLVAKEAMACGVPVIASSFMGLKEIVDPSCGLLVLPKDVGALADAIHAVSGWSAEARRRRGKAARAKVLNRFTARASALQLCQTISDLRGGRA